MAAPRPPQGRKVDRFQGEKYNANIFVKAENLQKIGAFKFRGAINSILQLKKDQKTVLAWSSGNHAQAIASAAYLNKKEAIIVMPEDSPKAKLEGTRAWGAKIVTFNNVIIIILFFIIYQPSQNLSILLKICQRKVDDYTSYVHLQILRTLLYLDQCHFHESY